MPFTFEIDANSELIRETWTGQVDIAQIKDSCAKEWAHPNYRPGIPIISDFRQATSAVESRELMQFAIWFGDKDPPRKHAIVVGREVGFGFARMFSLMSDATRDSGSLTQAFYSYSEAEEWLRL